jgi:hypothetical protein
VLVVAHGFWVAMAGHQGGLIHPDTCIRWLRYRSILFCQPAQLAGPLSFPSSYKLSLDRSGVQRYGADQHSQPVQCAHMLSQSTHVHHLPLCSGVYDAATHHHHPPVRAQRDMDLKLFPVSAGFRRCLTQSPETNWLQLVPRRHGCGHGCVVLCSAAFRPMGESGA